MKFFYLILLSLFSYQGFGAVGVGANSLGFDTQVITWYSRCSTNTSITGATNCFVSPSTRMASTEFMRGVRNLNLYPGILLRVNLFCGRDFHNGLSDVILGAVQVPLIADFGNGLDISDIAQGAWAYAEQGASGGLSEPGASGKLDTGFIATNVFNASSNAGFSVYVCSANNTSTWMLGANDAGATDWGLVGPDYPAVGTRGDVWLTGLAYSDSGGKGFYNAEREGNTLNSYKNGVLKTTGATAVANITQVSMWLFCINQNGARSSTTTKASGGYALHKSITAAKELAYYNVWQRFQTCLGRQQ